MKENGREIKLAENIKYFREKKGISKTELGDRLNVSDVTVGYWESGRNEPRIGKIQQIASVLGISTDELVFYDPQAKKEILKKIPVLGRIAAGQPIEALQEVIAEIVPPYEINGETFGLVVKGDSMNQVVLDGHYAIFRKQSDIENGEIAAVVVNGYDATLKKVYKFKDLIILQPCSNNEDHVEQIYKLDDCEDIKIIGKYLYSVSPIGN